MLLMSLSLFVSGCATSDHASAGRETYTFKEWDGPALKVFTFEPENLALDAPVVIVMHGVQRNAADYRDNWIELATEHGLRIIAPEFSQKAFPGSKNYNLGGVNLSGPRAYDAIEPLFQHLKSNRGVTADTYILFGHSAGAQFVHRYVCMAQSPHLQLAIAANAGWYTMPLLDQSWPYGLAGAGDTRCTPEEWYQKPLLIMLGDQDNDPDAPSLRQTQEAKAQGPHRLARGLRFLRTAHLDAKRLDVELAWRFKVVEGVGHDNRGMAQAAAALLAEPLKATPQ